MAAHARTPSNLGRVPYGRLDGRRSSANEVCLPGPVCSSADLFQKAGSGRSDMNGIECYRDIYGPGGPCVPGTCLWQGLGMKLMFCSAISPTHV